MTDPIQISHVIFDMDGLLIDSERCYEIAYGNVVRQYGRKFTFELRQKVTGVPAAQSASFIISELSLPLSAEQFVHLTTMECAKQFSRHIPLMPGADRLVRHLHRHRVPIAIATSTRRVNFDLKTRFHRDFFSLFNHIIITPDEPEISRGKPDPQPFLVCASRFKPPPVDPSSVLVFEDSIAGVRAANGAGMRSVWVPDSRISSTPTALKPFLRLESLADFKPETVGLPAFQ